MAWTPRRHCLGGVSHGGAVDDGGVGFWPAPPHDPAASTPCRLGRCLRCDLGSLGHRSGASPGCRPPPVAGGRQRQRRAARSGCDTHAPGLPPTGCPHGLGKRVRTDSRTAAISGAWAGCLLGKHREATRRARRLWRGSRRPCGGRGVVSHCGARSKRDGENPRTVRRYV